MNTTTISISGICAIDGCTNTLGSTGKKGRPSKKCEQHKETCVVPGCTRIANSTECQYHRVDRYAKAKSEKANIEKWAAWFRERGWAVIPPDGWVQEPTPIIEPAPKDFWSTQTENPYALEGTALAE